MQKATQPPDPEAGTLADDPKSLTTLAAEDEGASALGEAAALHRAFPVPGPGGIGSVRWRICALLFFATTINYVDRQVLGILKPELSRVLGWSEVDYGNIVVAFQAAYALGLLAAGSLIDRAGTKLGYALSLIVWSAAAMSHALARTATGFGAARFALGLGEAGNFPAAVKIVAEWFPRRERALATGVFNAGSNAGAIFAPLTVPFIALHYGWQWAFIATGALGLVWLLFWIPFYHRPEDHPHLSPQELAYIRSDPPEPTAQIRWAGLFAYRQTWAFVAGKFLTDPVWWFYLFWLADFLKKNYGIGLSQVSLPLITIYLLADIGSVGGGWLSSRLIKRGWSVNAGRKTAMLLCAICVVPVIFAVHTSQLWIAVGLISLAAAAHQGWSANLFTLASDMFPRRAVGSVVGIGGMAGAVGGMVFAATVSHILQRTHSNYVPIFLICGVAYLTALGAIQLLVPRIKVIELSASEADQSSPMK